MRRVRYASIAYALAIAFLASSASAEAQADDRLARGIEAHDAVFAGDFSRLGEARRLLGTEAWDRPPLALAYHGSVLTLEASLAKRKGSLMKALSLIDEGTKEIDSAIALDPGNIELRALRIENSVSLVEASPVDRKPEAAQDIAYLRTRWAELGPEKRALVELDSGRLALADRRLGDANAFWRKAVREAPYSDAAARAKKLIARYGD
jgi:hypothetical protein